MLLVQMKTLGQLKVGKVPSPSVRPAPFKHVLQDLIQIIQVLKPHTHITCKKLRPLSWPPYPRSKWCIYPRSKRPSNLNNSMTMWCQVFLSDPSATYCTGWSQPDNKVQPNAKAPLAGQAAATAHWAPKVSNQSSWHCPQCQGVGGWQNLCLYFCW